LFLFFYFFYFFIFVIFNHKLNKMNDPKMNDPYTGWDTQYRGQSKERFVSAVISGLEEDLAQHSGEPTIVMKKTAKFLITNCGVMFTQKQANVIGKILTADDIKELGEELIERSEKMRELEKSIKETEKLLLEIRLARLGRDLKELEIKQAQEKQNLDGN